ncbi:hypothetical protein LJ655_03410 [Paraburkholderia sp. MMS20-SJTN17]|uniref:Uncharacterized protein n=1 Tax=Paraburkholderia translucens TaxID=2886945 RepID=A0ABS8K876_9BURK|nr:hypothetical protein [Paraburkholderia sp. MMS20-SJTN17]MCC8400948.1 hypothetical protein [Paraburkholderia sp. MMS20-SJTN17]
MRPLLRLEKDDERANVWRAARWERAQAYRLIDAATLAERLSPIGDIPSRESHVRRLLRLENDKDRAL